MIVTSYQVVSSAASGVIDDLLDIFFGRPSQRLAVYGTLTPDGLNVSELASLEGEWNEGSVQGVIEQRDGFLEFKWSTAAQVIAVRIFSAGRLSERFVRLDRFEGPRYQRVLVPVINDGKLSVCNIYQGKLK